MVYRYRTTIINSIKVGVNLCCKISINLERAGKKAREKRNRRKRSHALVAQSHLDNGETPSNDSGVTGVGGLLAEAKRKASASEKRV